MTMDATRRHKWTLWMCLWLFNTCRAGVENRRIVRGLPSLSIRWSPHTRDQLIAGNRFVHDKSRPIIINFPVIKLSPVPTSNMMASNALRAAPIAAAGVAATTAIGTYRTPRNNALRPPSAMQLSLDANHKNGLTRHSRRLDLKRTMFSRYLTLKEIYGYLNALAAANAHLMTIERIGWTYELRPIHLIRITAASPGKHRKPAIWIDAGIHPREWISISTALYLIYELVTAYRSDPVVRELLERYEWYILPVVNPDGYVYTWTKDRMWRKNRSRHSHSLCTGVDLNRNFGFFFGGPGTSPNACHEKYPGRRPFSEAETWAIQNRTLYLRPQLVAFISMHSYDQFWMVPYGPTIQKPKYYKRMINMAQLAADAIWRTSGKHYRTGTIAELAGLVGGGSIDWAYHVLKVPYPFAIEMRDTGRSGFLLPANQIIPTGREIWAAIRTVAQKIAKELPVSLTPTLEQTESASLRT